MSSIMGSQFEVPQTGNAAVTMEQKPFPADTLPVSYACLFQGSHVNSSTQMQRR